MKKVIYASEILEAKDGFLFEFRNKAIFLESDQRNVTDRIARKMINAVCDLKQVGDKIRQAALYDKATLSDFKRRIDRAYLEKKDTGKIIMYTISGNGFTMSFPEEDFESDVIVI